MLLLPEGLKVIQIYALPIYLGLEGSRNRESSAGRRGKLGDCDMGTCSGGLRCSSGARKLHAGFMLGMSAVGFRARAAAHLNEGLERRLARVVDFQNEGVACGAIASCKKQPV